MILSEQLKDLKVLIKGGGSLVSHRPLFSPDSKQLFVISSNTILVYDTTSCLLSRKYQIPTDLISSMSFPLSSGNSNQDVLIISTANGEILEYDLNKEKILKRDKIVLKRRFWWAIISVSNSLTYKSRDKEFSFFLGMTEMSVNPSLYMGRKKFNGEFDLERLCCDVISNQHSVAIGGEIKDGFLLVAAILEENSLYVFNLGNSMNKYHLYGSKDRKLTCVAVHPNQFVVATGDSTGRIILWQNVFAPTPTKSVFHWHTLPVADLAFSVDGTQIYSGGGECTLVKWNLNEFKDKRTIPRMGLPFRHISVSTGNSLVAISQADNSILLLDEEKNTRNFIRNLTQCIVLENEIGVFAKSDIFKAGILFDPNTQAFLMNGKPGHLQSYSLTKDKHIYDLDITQQNFITNERNKTIANSDISHMSFSKKGNWLATVESRIQDHECTELKLKFWKFNREKQRLILNTSIDWPHERGVKTLRVQPIENDENTYLIAATTGEDDYLKTWGILTDSSIHEKSDWWNCETSNSYRGLTSGPLAFSHDGTVICAAFCNVLTLWDVESHTLRGSLCHSALQDSITLLELGQDISSHLAIACSENNLMVWDLITFTLLWSVDFSADSIAVDPLSNLVAAFSSNQDLIFFKPEHPDKLAVHKGISRSKVISSLFIRNQDPYSQLKSTLVFINETQELAALVSFNDEKMNSNLKIKKDESIGLTPFAEMIAEKTNKELIMKNEIQHAGFQEKKILKDILETSPHTMPSLKFFSQQLLQNLNIVKNPYEKQQEFEEFVIQSKKGKKQKGKKKLPNLSTVQNTSSKSQIVETGEKLTIELDIVSKDENLWLSNIMES